MSIVQSQAEIGPTPVASRGAKAIGQAVGLARRPQRLVPLLWKLAADGARSTFEQRHLYSYSSTGVPSDRALKVVVQWILDAQRGDGGIAAYYGLLDGYSESYPEVTGYIIPTLYDYARLTRDDAILCAADRAAQWLTGLQMPSGAFPGGLQGSEAGPSVFNTGQILQGLVRSAHEQKSHDILRSARIAGDSLLEMQQPDGSWSGIGAYQGVAHSYYTMVAWSLALLATATNDDRYANAARSNANWVKGQMRASGWIDGINLKGHPTYLHFIAYAIQGMLEVGVVLHRLDLVEAAARPAWLLLKRFETHKHLGGTYEQDFHKPAAFTCLTGNAQMSCVWLRLYEITRDLRYLNAALKMNESLKQLIPLSGGRGVRGGIAGSYPIWGAYQPLRYISWGCKFFADALILEQRIMQTFEDSECES
ncbi:MAG TPA: prenyltransferase/squalene oxidase repeat-containing protein [Terriglobales bacterium]|nr:prenyltransferase/squalene oxidase repeat-containing protein [Terriglobales bacterium]